MPRNGRIPQFPQKNQNFFPLKGRAGGGEGERKKKVGSDQISLKTMQVLPLNSIGFFEVYENSHMLDTIN